MVRYDAGWTVNFFYNITRVWRNVLVQVRLEVGGSNERLSQVDGIGCYRYDRHPVSVSHPVFDHRGLVTAGNTIAPCHILFYMGGVNRKHIPLPFPGRKARP